MKDFIPVVNDKYEPKQEWAMVREYRERALARRLDSYGARLEQYTRRQEVLRRSKTRQGGSPRSGTRLESWWRTWTTVRS